MIKYEGLISPETDGIVHHMEVFHCVNETSVKAKSFRGPCKVFGAERPEGLEDCRQVIGAWAMGAIVSHKKSDTYQNKLELISLFQPLTYPEEAGYLIGGEDYSPYIMMEMHFNNPGHIKGPVPTSSCYVYSIRTRDLDLQQDWSTTRAFASTSLTNCDGSTLASWS